MSDLPKTSRSLLRLTGIVGVMTMLSRVLGLARDIVIATLFGAGAGADAFFVAFKIPNFLRRLFAEGAFSQAFVPVLSEYRSQQSHVDVKILVNSVAGTLGLVLALVTVIAVAAAPWLTALFAPGFLDDPVRLSLTQDMLRITFPYLLLISLTAFAGSILNSYDFFAVPAFTPVLLNLSLIAAALLFSSCLEEPVLALAWGVLIGGMIQFLFQMPFLWRLKLVPTPRSDFNHPGVRRILKLMTPAMFGVSVSQINLLLDTILASFLVTGSISWLYYSDRLTELPLGVFGIAIATVILPSLSRKHVGDHREAFSKTLDWAVRSVLLIGAPATVALIILAEPLIATLFQHGAMTPGDVEMSARSLRAYSLGLCAFMLIKVLAPGFFSRQDTKTPVKIGILAMAANMVLNLALILPLAHVGLALATALSAMLNAALLWRGLQKQGVFWLQPNWARFLLQLIGANLIMVVVIYLINPGDAFWYEGPWLRQGAYLLTLCLTGLLAYLASLWCMGVRLKDFKDRG